MLGRRIVDGLESDVPEIDGLGLLPIETRFAPDKRTVRLDFRGLTGWLEGISGNGYEIHAGRIDAAHAELWLEAAAVDGARYAAGWKAGNVWGTMVHGLFDHDDVRHAFVRRCLGIATAPTGNAYRSTLMFGLDALADSIDREIGAERLLSICRTAG
jgi:adenosylcobyric acid synthase